MYKNELAQAAGVTLSTFSRWLRPHQPKLQQLGNPPKCKMLNPAGVKYVCQTFCIDI